MSAYRMDRDSVIGYVGDLNRFRPVALIGYPSALSHMSEMMLSEGLRVRPPRVILVSGETLYDWQRSLIERAFGTSVYNHYGCCEFGAVARECPVRNGLHMAAERLLVELEPVAGLATGEEARELITTDLDNYGMPFIRYAIGDYGDLIWDKCECGLNLPRLRAMIGRTYDLVKAPNGNYLGGTFWGHILKDGVHVFQVVQEELDRVRISVVPDGDFGEPQMNAVVAKVREACGPSMQVEFEVRERIEPTQTGKHRYVISRLSPGSASSPPAGPETGGGE
jgi:phenylacetate-CoA ligase